MDEVYTTESFMTVTEEYRASFRLHYEMYNGFFHVHCFENTQHSRKEVLGRLSRTY